MKEIYLKNKLSIKNFRLFQLGLIYNNPLTVNYSEVFIKCKNSGWAELYCMDLLINKSYFDFSDNSNYYIPLFENDLNILLEHHLPIKIRVNDESDLIITDLQRSFNSSS